VVVSSLKISERMCSEEVTIDALAGGLPCHRLCTVLTKLGEMTLITFRPRATRAIEALALVNQRKCP
jgi:hypothetical protein